MVGLRVQVERLARKYVHSTVVDGLVVHETVHIDQFYKWATNPEILEGQPAGLQITRPRKYREVFESEAYDAETAYLQRRFGNLGRRQREGREGKAIEKRLEQIRVYRDEQGY